MSNILNTLPILNTLLIVLIVFLGVALGSHLLLKVAANSRVRSRVNSLDRLTQSVPTVSDPHGPAADRGAAGAETDASIRPELLPTVSGWLDGSAVERNLRTQMVRAGLRLRPAEFAAICVASMTCLGLYGFTATHKPVMALALALGGLLVPIAILRQRQQRRLRLFEAQLPDTLTLIVSSLRSGYSLMRAMQMVADEMPWPISEEFGWLMAETTLGVPLDTALQRLIMRTGSYDMDLIATAMIIQFQIGGNMAEILNSIGETIRERSRVQGEISALTAEGKLSAFILMLMPVLLAVVLNLRNPDYFKPMLATLQGTLMLIGGFVAQVVGGIIIKNMVHLE